MSINVQSQEKVSTGDNQSISDLRRMQAQPLVSLSDRALASVFVSHSVSVSLAPIVLMEITAIALYRKMLHIIYVAKYNLWHQSVL